jgi:hypothetical protein
VRTSEREPHGAARLIFKAPNCYHKCYSSPQSKLPPGERGSGCKVCHGASAIRSDHHLFLGCLGRGIGVSFQTRLGITSRNETGYWGKRPGGSRVGHIMLHLRGGSSANSPAALLSTFFRCRAEHVFVSEKRPQCPCKAISGRCSYAAAQKTRGLLFITKKFRIPKQLQ